MGESVTTTSEGSVRLWVSGRPESATTFMGEVFSWLTSGYTSASSVKLMSDLKDEKEELGQMTSSSGSSSGSVSPLASYSRGGSIRLCLEGRFQVCMRSGRGVCCQKTSLPQPGFSFPEPSKARS